MGDCTFSSTPIKIIKRVTINKSPWIKLERIFYRDPRSDESKASEASDSPDHFKSYMCKDDGSPLNLGNNIRYWDMFTRNSCNNSLNVHSATTLAFCFKLVNNSYSFFVCLVEQFRPSVNSRVLEFPGGICDRDESVCECGVRELREETGYTGVAVNNSPNLPTTVLGNDNTCLVTVLVDLDAEVNLNPVQELEPTECVAPHLFPIQNLLQSLENYCANNGCRIADNLYFFSYALSLFPYEALCPYLVDIVKSHSGKLTNPKLPHNHLPSVT